MKINEVWIPQHEFVLEGFPARTGHKTSLSVRYWDEPRDDHLTCWPCVGCELIREVHRTGDVEARKTRSLGDRTGRSDHLTADQRSLVRQRHCSDLQQERRHNIVAQGQRRQHHQLLTYRPAGTRRPKDMATESQGRSSRQQTQGRIPSRTSRPGTASSLRPDRQTSPRLSGRDASRDGLRDFRSQPPPARRLSSFPRFDCMTQSSRRAGSAA